MSDEKIRSLPRWRESSCYSELERAAIEYAEEMTKTPVSVPDSLFERLRSFMEEPALVELTAAIAWENHRARMNHALELPSEGLYASA